MFNRPGGARGTATSKFDGEKKPRQLVYDGSK